jgi:hypothetical protein
MSELSVTAISVATRTRPDYRPVAALPGPDDDTLALADGLARYTGIPVHRLWLLPPEDPDSDVGEAALTGLGEPAGPQPLFLVRSGPLRDSKTVELARLVHETDWPGADIGITHLDELGGTQVFDLLDWAVDELATVLVCDDPVFVDALSDTAAIAAVGLRVHRGDGPLRVLDCGEGAPPRHPGRRFGGPGACDGWLARHAALRAGQLADGEEFLLHAKGPCREGWLALAATHLADLRLTDANDRAAHVARPRPEVGQR